MALDMQLVDENAPELPSGSFQAVFIINNMDCPSEEALIRNQLSTINGVAALEFNLMQGKLTVTHTLGKSEAILQALIAFDMKAVPLVATAIRAQSSESPLPNFT